MQEGGTCVVLRRDRCCKEEIQAVATLLAFIKGNSQAVVTLLTFIKGKIQAVVTLLAFIRGKKINRFRTKCNKQCLSAKKKEKSGQCPI